MLNQLVSDKNKTFKKRTRVESACGKIIKNLDDILENKKIHNENLGNNYKTEEKPFVSAKSQKILNALGINKSKGSVYMSDNDLKNSKRIQKMFKIEEKFQRKLPKKIPENMVKEFLANSKKEVEEKPKPNENKIEIKIKKEKEIIKKKEKEIIKKKEYDPFDFTLA